MQKVPTRSTVVVMALLAVSTAWAGPSDDSDREAARVATKQAAAAYNLGHYDEAASQYEEAYRLVPDPIFLYDLGQSYRQANKLDKALTAYRSYLRTAPNDAPNLARVRQWIDELERTLDLQAKTAAQRFAQREKPSTPVVPAKAVSESSVPQSRTHKHHHACIKERPQGCACPGTNEDQDIFLDGLDGRNA